jgi:hypothetical protein
MSAIPLVFFLLSFVRLIERLMSGSGGTVREDDYPRLRHFAHASTQAKLQRFIWQNEEDEIDPSDFIVIIKGLIHVMQ